MITVMYKALIWLLFIIYEVETYRYRAVKFVAWHNEILYFNLSYPFPVFKITTMTVVVMSFLGIQTQSA